MGGQELIDCLEQTGTGRDKLRHARNLVHERPQATGEDVLAALEKAGVRSEGGPNRHEGTLHKARRLLTGDKVAVMKELEGTPPKNAKEDVLVKAVERLASSFEQMHAKNEEKQAEAQTQSIGRPVKPATSR